MNKMYMIWETPPKTTSTSLEISLEFGLGPVSHVEEAIVNLEDMPSIQDSKDSHRKPCWRWVNNPKAQNTQKNTT